VKYRFRKWIQGLISQSGAGWRMVSWPAADSFENRRIKVIYPWAQRGFL
jgi:hypothetical protein